MRVGKPRKKTTKHRIDLDNDVSDEIASKGNFMGISLVGSIVLIATLA